jgi:protein-S-isoprenylcysteine O-methyltransferase Ste14
LLPPRPDLVFIGIGIVSIAVGLPMADRRIKPNHWYGVRIRETFADERIWYEVNAQAGRDLVLLGVLAVVAAVTLSGVLPPPAYAAGVGLGLGAGAMLMLVRSVRLARRMWRERGDGRAGAPPS